MGCVEVYLIGVKAVLNCRKREREREREKRKKERKKERKKVY